MHQRHRAVFIAKVCKRISNTARLLRAQPPLEVGVDPWPDQKRSMFSTLCLMGASGAGLFFYLKILK
jgi:hypothetical protein